MTDMPPVTSYTTPAIRHLAWMLRTPRLYNGRLNLEFDRKLSAAAVSQLQYWDTAVEVRPTVLDEIPHPRLGLYFERLYECLTTSLLGWELVAKNLPVRKQGRTLGELDFVMRDPVTCRIEHHEIAVKYYLGYSSPESGAVLWYGPNAKDRLDIKTQHLLTHQSRMCEREETIAALEQIDVAPPVRPRIFMPGYLFYPTHQTLIAPEQVDPDHLRGHWCYLRSLNSFDISHWVVLRKPHWLGPWVQSAGPNRHDTQAGLETVRLRQRPQLFARLQQCSVTGNWLEVERYFVVPDEWPFGKQQ